MKEHCLTRFEPLDGSSRQALSFKGAVAFGFLVNKGNLLFTRSPEETAHLKGKDLRQVKKYIFVSTKKSINTVCTKSSYFC